ncbi:MAG: hypothetical protein BBJ57_04970 [Desulfobacterales bacterium PC51MH44]|nr:MAG: hypothetical protein BBJ57_04970 [Desulfobacterales bacterium PC51MH44]
MAFKINEMKINRELQDVYDKHHPRYKSLKDEVIFILEKQLKSNNIPFDAIYGRVKDINSLQKKIRDNECTSPFQEIDDICGVRVVCLFPSHMKEIDNIITSNFTILERDDKIGTKPAESFGYLSMHYTALIADSYSGARYDDLKKIKFEIQLRTIAAHAWCAISHHIDYKYPNAVPTSLQKQFHALSALFYLADENFEMLYKASQEFKDEANLKNLVQIGKEEINYDILDVYLRKRFSSREPAPPQYLSLLSEELYRAGYRTIADLENKLTGAESAVEVIEDTIFGKGVRNFHNVGVVRNALSVVDDNYDKCRLSPLLNPEISRKDYRKYIKKQ